ncbi:MAG: hypothetical protein LBH40_01290 [Alphaproteobacteria bacterium]|jgi:hypothetical protein|nr:hypothetical protein [Alphaproteobacteria bacterium]
MAKEEQKEAQKPKKEIGSFSVKYLRSLFVKETSEKIPELQKDFVYKRYYESDNEVYEDIEKKDTSHEKLTDVYISEIRNITKNKLEDIKNLSSTINADDDFETFIERKSNEDMPLPKARQKRSKIISYDWTSNNKVSEGIDKSYLEHRKFRANSLLETTYVRRSQTERSTTLDKKKRYYTKGSQQTSNNSSLDSDNKTIRKKVRSYGGDSKDKRTTKEEKRTTLEDRVKTRENENSPVSTSSNTKKYKRISETKKPTRAEYRGLTDNEVKEKSSATTTSKKSFSSKLANRRSLSD